MTNAKEFLNYRLELSKLHLLHQVMQTENSQTDIVFQGWGNTGVILLKISSNQVSCDIRGSVNAMNDTELDKECDIILLDTKGRVDKLSIDSFVVKGIKDKNIAIVIKFRYPILLESEKRGIAKCLIEGTFMRSSDPLTKKTESTLSLNNPKSLLFSYKSYLDLYAIDIENNLGFGIVIDRLTIAGVIG